MFAVQKVLPFLLLTLLFPQTPSKQELNDQLFEAVRKGDVAAVTAALDKGADVNAKDMCGDSPLDYADQRPATSHAMKALLSTAASKAAPRQGIG